MFDFFQPIRPARAVQVMAHRGLKAEAPENTLPAFQKAIDAGVEWVEIDLRLTRDGHHVLLHDATLDRTTSGVGLISEMDLAALKILDAGAWFSPAYAGQRLLTHAEALDFCRGRINLYLDCKQADPARLVREICDAHMERQVVVFDGPERLEEVRTLSDGAVPVMPSINRRLEVGYWVDHLRPAAVEAHAHLLTPDLVAGFHDAGVIVQAQTLGPRDRPEVWRACFAMGMDWIQTDFPGEVLAELLDDRAEDPMSQTPPG